MMETLLSFKHLLLLGVELVAAFTTIWAFASKLKKKVTEPITALKDEVAELRKEIKELKEKDVKPLKKHEYDTWVSMLRLIICSDEMPISERLAAGEIYVNQEGLNGEVKCRYEKLREQYKDEVL